MKAQLKSSEIKKISQKTSFLLFIIFILPAFGLAQLSGEYSIGPSGDYNSFIEAAAALESLGINGAVVLNVQTGTYEEHFVLNQVSGTSETNTITFQSDAGNTDSVLVFYHAQEDDSNYVVKLNNVQHVTFKDMTFQATGEPYHGIIFDLGDFSTNINFMGNVFDGIPANDASAGRTIIFGDERHIANIHVNGNTFYEGSYGVFLEGWNDTFIFGTEIIGNTFIQNGYSGVYTNWNYAPKINYNTVEAKSYGIRVNGDHGAGQYSFNRINSGRWGMNIHHIGEGIPRAVVSNNFISIGDNGSYGITIQNSNNIDIYYNSVYVNSNSRTSSAFYSANAAYLTNVNIRNNNFANLNSGYALHIGTPDAINLLDHNNLYTAGNYIGTWGGAKVDRMIDLKELQKVSGKNSYSLSVYPHYTSYYDLHTSAAWLDGKGTPIVDLIIDIDGETRDATNPDIGADEFTPDPATTAPLSQGSYTIGAGGDYADFSSAIWNAVMKGISVPTTFNVLDGTYNEQIDIISIPGSSPTNRVTFQSESGDTADVKIIYQATNQDSNYVIRNFGADFITIRNLTVQATGDPYARVLDLYCGSDSIEIKNNYLIGIEDSGNDARQAIIYSADSYYWSRILDGNKTEQGTFAAYMRRAENGDRHVPGTAILNNNVQNNGYTGFYIQFHDGPVFEQNTISGSSFGIQVLSSDSALKINKNRIYLSSGDTGIKLSSCFALDLNRSLISNNFVTAQSRGTSKGISLNYSTYVNIYYNSVNILTPSFQSIAFELTHSGSQNINIINNNFACLEDGYAYSIENESSIYVSDYNNYYSPANFLAKWNGDKVYDLPDLKKISVKNLNSLSVYPHYSSADDLHTIAPWLDNRGTTVAEINDDIDGEPRDFFRPDIGADEFEAAEAAQTPLSGLLTIGDGGDYVTINQAKDDAVLKGIDGPVVFNIKDGIYNEQLEFLAIPGANPDNPVTFQSESQDTSKVKIEFESLVQDSNYTLQLFGGDFIHFNHLTIKAKNNVYACAVDFYLGADSIEIDHCRFLGSYNNNAQSQRALIISEDSYYWSRIFSNNRLEQSAFGFYLRREAENRENPIGTVITQNIIDSCGYTGVYLQFVEAPELSENIIQADHFGIDLLSCDLNLLVSKNRITGKGYRGVSISSCFSTIEQPGLITNNFIQVGASGETYGIYLNNSHYQYFLNNSVNNTTPARLHASAFYLGVSIQGRNNKLLNNIFHHSEEGYAIFYGNDISIEGSDYNDLFTKGDALSNFGATLAELQTATGNEPNSVSIDPQFTSDEDLHTSAVGLDGAGASLAAVPDDIDGQNRHPQTPDIGADEFLLGANNSPTLVHPIPDTTLAEDNTSNLIRDDLNFVFHDPDPNDVLSFTAISSNEEIKPIIEKVSLLINYKTNYMGSAEIIVRATDLGGLFVTDTFLVDISEVNDPPIAVDDYTKANTNLSISIYILDNDTDPDKDPIRIMKSSQPIHGTIEIGSGNDMITYTSFRSYVGPDTFMYFIEDQRGGIDSAVVYIEVIPLFEAINAGIDSVSHSSVAWGDFDNDQDLDLLITGWPGGASNYISKIYKNDQGIFTEGSYNLEGVSPGSPGGAVFGDLENDEDLDFIISGVYETTGNTEYKTLTYLNLDELPFYHLFNFENVTSGSASWGDYDNDGLLDLLLAGSPSVGEDITKIYRQTYDNTLSFYDINAGLPGLGSGKATWVDFDTDGDLDVFLCGFGVDPSKLFENIDGTFQQMNNPIGKFGNSDAAWGDYDSDGDMDLLIIGDHDNTATSKIFRNDGPAPGSGWIFTDISADLEQVKSGSVAWGDVDNDGDLDLILTGSTESQGEKTRLYYNIGGIFEQSSLYLPDLTRSAAAFGDYDLDYDLDLILTGMDIHGRPMSVIYENKCVFNNELPTPPENLRVEINGNDVTFKWSPPTDDHTSSMGLTYNIGVGTDFGAHDVVTPMSGAAGLRKIPAYGNAGQDTSYTIKGLETGVTYYWKVQSIDNSFVGSWYPEVQTFVITDIEESNNSLPETYSLNQNYPNPFNPSTTITFDLPIAGDVHLILYNILGQEVSTLANKHYSAGQHQYIFDATRFAAGVYFYKIKTGKFHQVRKMLLIK